MKTTIMIIMVLTLTNCSTSRSTTGAILGGTTTTAVCVENGLTDPYAAAGCAIIGAFAGA